MGTISDRSLRSLTASQGSIFHLMGKSIYPAPEDYTHSDHVQITKDMPLDSNKKIGKMKDIAIARCMERIEQAACKAKELMNKPKREGQERRDRSGDQSHEITSFLKKRHGL